MSEHDRLRLRVITVSARAALKSGLDNDSAALVTGRADELLGDLERDVLADGAEPDLLGDIAEARMNLLSKA